MMIRLHPDKCSVCVKPHGYDTEMTDVYPDLICRDCDERCTNAEGQTPETYSEHDCGDNPVFVDGVKCWRRYRFGGWVTMRDRFDCSTLEEFYKRMF